jgi:hypothetical protein
MARKAFIPLEDNKVMSKVTASTNPIIMFIKVESSREFDDRTSCTSSLESSNSVTVINAEIANTI